MPSKKVYLECLKAGYRVDKIAYEKYDSLASDRDLEFLFELLTNYKDHLCKHPVFTANVLAANPDFEKIEQSDFKQYHYELLADTFQRYPSHTNALSLWKEGYEKGVFYMQSHGREHLNISRFMVALKSGDRDAHFGFKCRMPGCIQQGVRKSVWNDYVEALNYTDHIDKSSKLEIILEGLDLFEKLFNYRSASFIPPNYIWSPHFDSKISEAGVKYYQGIRKFKVPGSGGTFDYLKRWLGNTNCFGQVDLIRNAFFEPSLAKSDNIDTVDRCLYQIGKAFSYNKPAIICTHRLNYIGYINETNRDRNLKSLRLLLDQILKKWPDVEFKNSTELGSIIEEDTVC